MLVQDLFQNTPKNYPILKILCSSDKLAIQMDSGDVFLLSDSYCGFMFNGEPRKVTPPMVLYVAEANFKINVYLYDIMGLPLRRPRFVLSFTDQSGTGLSMLSLEEDNPGHSSELLRDMFVRCKAALLATGRVQIVEPPAMKTISIELDDDDSEMHDNEWSESQCEISKLIQKKLHNELLKVKSLDGVVELDASNIDINEKGEYVITVKANRV